MIISFEEKFTKDDQWRNGHGLLFQSVIDEFNLIYPMDPVAGQRKIYIQPSKDGVPRCDHTKNINFYYIFLSSPDGQYNKLSFQFAHELGHILCDPRRSNRMTECLCEMLSHIVLKRLTQKWKIQPPLEGWQNYAFHFEEMLNFQTSLSRKQVGLNSSDGIKQLKNWLVTKTGFFIKNKTDDKSRKENSIVAELLLPIFEKNIQSFYILPYLGQSTNHPVDLPNLLDWNNDDSISLNTWKSIVPSNIVQYVIEVEKIIQLTY
jgi:hypothetical protein